jgi:hypothetical protein
MAYAAMGYRATLDWLIINDDIMWLDDGPECASVTAMLVADIFGKPIDVIVADLRGRRKKRSKGP